MSYISPTIKIDISHTLAVTENISMGESCSLTELDTLKHLLQEFRDIFSWSYYGDAWPRSYHCRTPY